jgi:hypothetical protein
MTLSRLNIVLLIICQVEVHCRLAFYQLRPATICPRKVFGLPVVILHCHCCIRSGITYCHMLSMSLKPVSVELLILPERQGPSKGRGDVSSPSLPFCLSRVCIVQNPLNKQQPYMQELKTNVEGRRLAHKAVVLTASHGRL